MLRGIGDPIDVHEIDRDVMVLETGLIALEGPSRELLGNEHVKRLYLGA